MIFNEGNVKIELLDIMGRTVKNVHEAFAESDIEYSVEINSTGMKAGIYLLRIQSPDGIVTEKLTVVK
jgi:hypothetical protein